MVPAVGSEAPDFTLPSTSGDQVTLSAMRGRSNVVLAFFPLAFTSVCTTEMCDFTIGLDEFSAMSTMVFGISVDSVPTLKEFKAKHGIRIDLLSDFKRIVCRAYGTLLEEPFFSQRAYFIIDKAGLIRWSHIEAELGARRANEELLTALQRVG
jgi:peroxiredoxin